MFGALLFTLPSRKLDTWEDGESNNRNYLISYVILVQFSSVTQSCPTLCDPMNHSTPGLPAHYQLPEFTQTHVHQVSDAIQPSHPLSSPSPPAYNPSQHQSLFQWVNSLHEVPKVLEFQLYHHSFQRTSRANLLQNGLVGCPCNRQTFVGKVMSLLFNMLSRLAITFLPRTKCLLISWLQSSSAVILEPPK